MSWHGLYVSRMGNLRYVFVRSVTFDARRLFSNASGAGGVGRVAIQVAIGEVILFVMYQVLNNVITNINLTGVLKGTNGTLTTLVTLFYLLGAALVPLALVKHAGFL